MVLKNIIAIIYLGVALFLNLLFSGDASVELFVPDEVEAGEKFRVLITIDKGVTRGFARLQQSLPHGLKGTRDLSANSEFTFKAHKAKFLWLNLPEEEQLTLSYYLEVDERVMGDFKMGGTFSYIANNQRMSIKVDPKTIHINPSPNVEYSVDINEFKEDYIYEKPMQDLISCIRQKPYLNNATNEYMVNLLVYKKNLEKFAKIEEVLPLSVGAYAKESQNPIFVFKNNTAKYIWMDLPKEQYFVVNYKLSPNEVSIDDIKINGHFSYDDNGTTQIVEIIQRDDIDLTNTDIGYLEQVVKSSNDLIVKAKRHTQVADIPEDKPDVATTGDEVDQKNSDVATADDKGELTPTLDPEQGIYYRVQLAAGHKPVNIKKYFKKYNLKHEVKSENHDGWIKYSIGAFTVYKDARDYRVFIWNTTAIDDAFVAAYNSGKRITVQEALMIANHKWYR